MAMFHVDPVTGEAARCSNSVRQCPAGSADNHYTSEEAALEAARPKVEETTLDALERFNEEHLDEYGYPYDFEEERECVHCHVTIEKINDSWWHDRQGPCYYDSRGEPDHRREWAEPPMRNAG